MVPEQRSGPGRVPGLGLESGSARGTMMLSPRLPSQLRLPMLWAARGVWCRRGAAPPHQAPWPQTFTQSQADSRVCLTQACQRRDGQTARLERSQHRTAAWRWRPKKEDGRRAWVAAYFSSLASGLTPARSDRGTASQPGGGARRPGLTDTGCLLGSRPVCCLLSRVLLGCVGEWVSGRRVLLGPRWACPGQLVLGNCPGAVLVASEWGWCPAGLGRVWSGAGWGWGWGCTAPHCRGRGIWRPGLIGQAAVCHAARRMALAAAEARRTPDTLSTVAAAGWEM